MDTTSNCPECKSGNTYPHRQSQRCGDCGAAFKPVRPLTPEQAATKTQLDRIESTLAALGRALDQERADLGTADYSRATELIRVAGRLDEIESFWTCNGPEHTE
jgi:hypothetical protein